MLQYLSKSFLLLTLLVMTVCIVYPLSLWTVGQAFFSFAANGSALVDEKGVTIGSKLIAQPFTKDEYFQPRPSAAGYNATASASSSLAASNYALRDRVARSIGSIVMYQNGQPVAPDIEKWFQQNIIGHKSGIVAEWATRHNALAASWVSADPTHTDFVNTWMKTHPTVIEQFVRDNPRTPQPKAPDLAVVFFQNFSKENPGKFPAAVSHTDAAGKTISTLEPVGTGQDIQTLFFDMWREDHRDANIRDIPGDFVTASGSGLDPHITLQNAEFQLNRIAGKWSQNLKRNPSDIQQEIEQILQQNVSAPFGGLIGEKIINVLEVNLELHKRYGLPQQSIS